jgi:hypothetical protein
MYQLTHKFDIGQHDPIWYMSLIEMVKSYISLKCLIEAVYQLDYHDFFNYIC